MRARALLFVALAADLAACLTVPLDDRPCGAGGECLAGYVCFEGECVRPSEVPVDGGLLDDDGGALPDAGGSDGGPLGDDAGAGLDAGPDVGPDAGALDDGGATDDDGGDGFTFDDAGPLLDDDAGPPLDDDAGAADGGPLDDDAGPDGGPGCVPYGTLEGEGPLALYPFDDGSGAVVRDRSGLAPALDLTIAFPATTSWGPTGLTVLDTAQRTTINGTAPATRVIDACRASGRFTIEAWMTNASAARNGPDRIASLSSSTDSVNVALSHGDDGNTQSRFEARLRTTNTDGSNGNGYFTATGLATTSRQHLAWTFDAATGVGTLFIDGALHGTVGVGGDLSNWNTSHVLAVAASPNNSRHWFGTLHLVAFYCRALTTAEVAGHFASGPELDGTRWCAPPP